MSKQKDAVLSVLQDSEGHLRADEIFALVREKIPNISVGTVYRNLGILYSEGKIHKITVPNCGDVYDKTAFPHGHLICGRCLKVYDMPWDEADQVEKSICRMKDMGHDIVSYNFTAEIVCGQCKSNQNADSN